MDLSVRIVEWDLGSHFNFKKVIIQCQTSTLSTCEQVLASRACLQPGQLHREPAIFRKALCWYNTVIAILKFLVFQQEILYLHFVLCPANYITNPISKHAELNSHLLLGFWKLFCISTPPDLKLKIVNKSGLS